MSDISPSTPPAAEESAPVDTADTPADSAASPRARVRWVLPTTLLVIAALVAAAVAWVALPERQHQDAAAPAVRTPGAGSTPSSGIRWDGSRFGPLTRLLAPMPEGYTTGPDIPGLGSDTQISGTQYEQHELSLFPGLSVSERREMAELMDSRHVTAVAVRSYTGSGVMISIELTQESRGAAAVGTKLMGLLEKDLTGGKPGPKVPGYPKAVCTRTAKTGDKKFDSVGTLDCTAAVGGVLVQMEEVGPAPLATTQAISLLKQQLDRLAVPDQES
ncbi:hypothetical protein [Phaeacidiphilus oryzae]|uniref:hypothetical protein n=1 Tax=Phaeacidiphilus oryzae TaxID=348818 RepID=UPI0005674503|nr:hypothetical protein [Phaeacidiphilus oryzae]